MQVCFFPQQISEPVLRETRNTAGDPVTLPQVFFYHYCHHGVQPVSTLSLGGRETGGTGRLHIRFTMLPSDEMELFICRISQQQCLKCRGETALVLVSNVHDRCLGPETGHTALLCSVLLPDQPGSVPDALARAAVSAAPVALLWLSSLCCITVAGLTKHESGWSCLVCCRGSDIFLGAQDPHRDWYMKLPACPVPPSIL